jgi:hypothetical protein
MNEEGVWQEILQNKYLKTKTLSQVSAKPTDSPFWKGLMNVKEEFFSRGTMVIGNGQKTRFWEDIWLGDTPLKDQYPMLYNIVNHANVTVAQALASNALNIGFRRVLTPYKWDRWVDLVTRVMSVQRTDSEDTFRWKLTNSGSFTVKSMYLDLLNDHTMYLKKYIWKIKVPLKIRIFMWFLHKGVILTKDNLIKRNWHGCTKCCFCDQEETIQHLFISCPFARILWRIIRITFNIYPPANITNLFGNWLLLKRIKVSLELVCALLWAIWNVRNDFIFNQKSFPSFLQVIPLVTHWIHMWSFLQPSMDRPDMDSGCNRLATVARDFYSRCGWRSERRLT